MKVYAILLCAGSGRRMGESRNKILLDIGGRSPVRRALDAINNSGCFEGVVIAARQEDIYDIREICGEEATIVCGGAERQDSVYNAMKSIPMDADIISIHDAARCFTSPELIRRCVKSAEQYGSGAAGKRCVDTVKTADGEEVTGTLDRSKLILIETPQAFSAKLIREAYDKAMADGVYGTDDCYLVERMGIKPRVVIHDEENFKLTYKSDLKRGEDLTMKDFKIGQGIDAHRLVEGRKLIIGGVEIPHDRGLLGHSDADVLVHAVMDALLGAASKRDIGKLFPDNDMAYKDADSIKLLEKVGELLKKDGWSVGNIDATVIAQKPKLSPFIDEMRNNIAAALNCEAFRVNIKATTTEKMGYEGREEGISAQSVCLIER